MLYLSDAAIDYAIAMCTSNPRYKVIIAVDGMEKRHNVFNHIVGSVERSPGMVISGGIRKLIGWQNGSTIRVVPCSDRSRGMRAHLVIADDNADEEIVDAVFRNMETLERIERRQRHEVFDMNTLANTHDETLWAVVIPSDDEEETEAIVSEDELMKILGVS